jgi:hypothetical protein
MQDTVALKKYKVIDNSRPIFYSMRKVGEEIELPADVGKGWIEAGLLASLEDDTFSKGVNIDIAISELEKTISTLESDLEKAKSDNKPKATITKIENQLNKAKAELLLLSDDEEEAE